MDNITGITNLLEYTRRQKKIKKVLHISTAEVFGPSKNNQYFKEHDCFNPKSPYAVSKICAQKLCDFYKEYYGIPITTTYTMNTFGRRQPYNKYIPLLIEKIYNEKTVEIHHSSDQSQIHQRNYLHVDDVCSAILYLIKNENLNENYNIISEEYVNNLQVAQTIASILDKELKYKLVEPLNKQQYTLSHLCGEKIRNLGWKQNKNLYRGLADHIKWVQSRWELSRWI